MASKTKPVLYALLIAIGDYQPPVGKLAGTIGDLRDMEAYLTEVESEHFTVKPLALVDDEATKDNIIAACREHFSKAGPEDSILLYYSGHGTREHAQASVWTSETNALLECLVCYDGVVKDQSGKVKTNLLADKELRYLLHQAGKKGAHICAIFDCCNSGENTRSTLPQVIRKFTPAGNGAKAFPQRDLRQFFFWDELKSEALINDEVQPLATWLPEGRHVQMAACRGREFAYENVEAQRGAFTESLLASLRKAQGKISYRDLQVEVGNNLRGRYDQRPEAYTSTHPEDLFSSFLGKTVEPRPNYGIVQFNQPKGDKAGRWVINLGSLSGLVRVGTKVNVASSKGAISAEVSLVNLDFSELHFAPAAAPDPTTTYRGIPDAQHLPALPFLLASTADAPEEIISTIKHLLLETEAVRPTDRAEVARYAINIDAEKTWLTLPGDHRPLVQSVSTNNRKLSARWRNDLNHLVEWHRLLDLENPSPHLFPKFPLRISIETVDERGQTIDLPDREYHQLAYLPKSNGKKQCTIKIGIENTHEEELFVALFAFGRDFYCTSKLLSPAVVALPAGGAAEIFKETATPGQLQITADQYLITDKWPMDTIWFKCIASTDETALKKAAGEFELPSLPHPDSRGNRGMAFFEPYETEPDWITRTVTIDIKL